MLRWRAGLGLGVRETWRSSRPTSWFRSRSPHRPYGEQLVVEQGTACADIVNGLLTIVNESLRCNAFAEFCWEQGVTRVSVPVSVTPGQGSVLSRMARLNTRPYPRWCAESRAVEGGANNQSRSSSCFRPHSDRFGHGVLERSRCRIRSPRRTEVVGVNVQVRAVRALVPHAGHHGDAKQFARDESAGDRMCGKNTNREVPAIRLLGQ